MRLPAFCNAYRLGDLASEATGIDAALASVTVEFTDTLRARAYHIDANTMRVRLARALDGWEDSEAVAARRYALQSALAEMVAHWGRKRVGDAKARSTVHGMARRAMGRESIDLD